MRKKVKKFLMEKKLGYIFGISAIIIAIVNVNYTFANVCGVNASTYTKNETYRKSTASGSFCSGQVPSQSLLNIFPSTTERIRPQANPITKSRCCEYGSVVPPGGEVFNNQKNKWRSRFLLGQRCYAQSLTCAGTICTAFFHVIPTCGSNQDIYGPTRTGRNTTLSTGWCAGGVLSGTTPTFPKLSQRTSGDIIIERTCKNIIGENVNCEAIVSKVEICGVNAKTYQPYEKDRITKGLFPNPQTGFCLLGTPSRYVPVLFPSINERKTTITRRWYCQVDQDTSSVCEATILPVEDGVCGANATTYDATKTKRKSETEQGFCLKGIFSGTNEARIFPRVRDEVQIKTWTCISTGGGVDATCQAVLEPNTAVCGTDLPQSILNINLVPQTKLCARGVPTIPQELPGLLEPRKRTCQTLASDDNTNPTIDEKHCTVHRSCTRNGYEYAHNQETIPMPIDGVCGSAHGRNFSENDVWYGQYQQCAKGKPDVVAFPPVNGYVTWKCKGINGGQDSPVCVATRYTAQQGVCGDAHGHIFAFTDAGYTPTYNQCKVGTPTDTTFPAPGTTVSWKCVGQYGGASDTCWTTRLAQTGQTVHGVCGGANNYTFGSNDIWYTTQRNQCASGIPVSLTGTAPNYTYITGLFFPEIGQSVSWICKGLNGGQDSPVCTAYRSSTIITQTGQCGTAHGRTFGLNETKFDPYTLCASGIPTITSGAFPSPGTSVLWTCMGSHRKADAYCRARREGITRPAQGATEPKCGGANGYHFTSFDAGFTDTLQPCEGGWTDMTGFITPGTKRTRTCYSTNLAPVTCSAYRTEDGMCGLLDGKIIGHNEVVSTGDYCLYGAPTVTTLPPVGTEISWGCKGISTPDAPGATDAVYCKLRRAAGPNPIPGVCGGADGHTFSATDIWYTTQYNQCTSGIPTLIAFPTRNSSVSWQCIGVNGGPNSPTCTAYGPTGFPVNGQCGTAHGRTFASTETSWGSYTQCASGTPTTTSFPQTGQYISRRCLGQNGGQPSTTCRAYRDVPYVTLVSNTGTAVTKRWTTNKPPLGKSCQSPDVIQTGRLYCDDGTWILDYRWGLSGGVRGMRTGSVNQIVQHAYDTCDDSANKTCILNGIVLQNGQSLQVYKNKTVARSVPGGCLNQNNTETFTCVRGLLTGLNPNANYQDYPHNTCQVEQPKPCEFGTQFGDTIHVNHGQVFKGYKKNILEWDEDCETTGTNGNTTILQCRDGTINVLESGNQAPASAYVYLSCTKRAPKDCLFHDILVPHGASITGWKDLLPAVGETCRSETRTCIDGVLSGTYQYKTCGTVNGQCGPASGGTFASAPTVNLCTQGQPYRPATGTYPQDKRVWMCLGQGGENALCMANKQNQPTLITGQCVQYPTGEKIFYLDVNMQDKLCLQGIATGLAQTATGRTRSCLPAYVQDGKQRYDIIPPVTSGMLATGCNVCSTKIPQATISYTPNIPTDGAVKITIRSAEPHVTIQSTIGLSGVQSTSGIAFLVTTNGTYTFSISNGCNTGYLTATVTWINNRASMFQTMLSMYQQNYCSLYANIAFADLRNNPYTVDMVTMKNTCIMHGYHMGGGRYMFLPNKKLTRGEALAVLGRLGSALTYYYGSVPENEQIPHLYKNVFEENEAASWLARAEALGITTHLKRKEQKPVTIKAYTPLTGTLYVTKPLFVPKGTLIASGSAFAKNTRFLKRTGTIDTNPEILSGLVLQGDVVDERNSFLDEVYVYTQDRTLDKDVYVVPGSYFSPGTKFPRDVNLLLSGYIVNLNEPIPRQEFANMLAHFLRIHGLSPDLKDRLMREVKFATPDHITRGEVAYIIRRLMEPYRELPIGNDYLLLKALYDKIKALPAPEMLNMLTLLQQALIKVPADTLTNYGLTRYRLLSDLEALKKNTLPDRKPRQIIPLQVLLQRRADRYNVETFVQNDTINFYTKNRYDELEW